MSDDPGLRVTIENLITGERETHEISNDYLIACAGSCYVDTAQSHGNGTDVLTIKRHA